MAIYILFREANNTHTERKKHPKASYIHLICERLWLVCHSIIHSSSTWIWFVVFRIVCSRVLGTLNSNPISFCMLSICQMIDSVCFAFGFDVISVVSMCFESPPPIIPSYSKRNDCKSGVFQLGHFLLSAWIKSFCRSKCMEYTDWITNGPLIVEIIHQSV